MVLVGKVVISQAHCLLNLYRVEWGGGGVRSSFRFIKTHKAQDFRMLTL